MKNNFILAAQSCISIFNDFDEDEVKEMPISICYAWEVGRALEAESSSLLESKQ